jgi:hypothetical protein
VLGNTTCRIINFGARHSGKISWRYQGELYLYTLWLFNIAMENGPFIDGLAIKKCDFPWLC